MEKLLESFKTLLHLGTQITFFTEVNETLTDNKEELNRIKFKNHYENLPFSIAISGSLQNYSHILFCSFIDEYNEEFTFLKHQEYSERIKRLKQITKPAMKKLNLWKDLKNYRNYFLAHNLRINKKSIFDTQFKTKYFNIPHTNAEIILASEITKIITICISQEFPDLVEHIDWNENILLKIKFNYAQIDVETEIKEIWNNIENIRKYN
jgi:hypothetical protein